jgi:2',3'-cyclic-nucleotide 2'-phosphodiesterase (5'-nucleotidase family)
MSDLTILHTNDLHGKLSKRAMEIIKPSCGGCLLLDSGDAISSGNIYYRPGGEPVLAQMSDLGYDAMAMGNREFHFLSYGLKSKIKLAYFPVLSANIRSKNSEISQLVQPSITKEINGLRIVIFGLTVPMITKRTVISPYWFEDPITAVQEIISQLRDKADILIALTHIGLQKDMELASAVPGIDLIIGGHSHKILRDPVIVGRTAIVQAGYWGRFLGKAEITKPDTPGGMFDIRETLIDLRNG